MKRRDFLTILGTGALAGGSANRAFSADVRRDAALSEPKSIHTWLESPEPDIYAYDVDVRINKFPTDPDKRWLYYFALQVNFTGHDEWSHGGLQWAGVKEFENSGNKGINWGGGSDWAGYGGIGRTNTPFVWDTGKWYRYRCWRLDPKDGLWRWLFALQDYETGKDGQYGTVVTKSKYIKSAVVWMETGYGVKCDTERAEVEWRSPVYRTPAGIFKPVAGTTSYNGTCEGSKSTEQGLISKDPLRWFQATNSRRTVAPGTKLWG